MRDRIQEKREDNSTEKRVELHLHTNYSAKDGILDVRKAIRRAKEWGMKALAITDHGVVQAFPEAYEEVKDDPDFKLIYGVEAYFVDDITDIVINGHGERFGKKQEYVAINVKTTGWSAKECKIIGIDAVRENMHGCELGRFRELVNPEERISRDVSYLSEITNDMVESAQTIDHVLPDFLEFAKDAILVTEDADRIGEYLRASCERLGLPFPFAVLDIKKVELMMQARDLYTCFECDYFEGNDWTNSDSCGFAKLIAKMFIKLLNRLRDEGITSVDKLNQYGHESVELIRSEYGHSGTILVKNEIGLVNLYQLISESHIKYFNDIPRIPISRIAPFRENLLVGSGFENGLLYEAIARGYGDEEMERIVNCFDYFELESTGRLVHPDLNERIGLGTKEERQEQTRRVIELGKKYGKPVVAVGDVHFLEPEDCAYQTVIHEGTSDPGWDTDLHGQQRKTQIVEGETPLSNEMLLQPPQYFRTTEEMLAEYAYLGEDLAREVVIENTNKIADMIENLSPIRNDRCLPTIYEADTEIEHSCRIRAHELYGPELPEQVSARMEKELDMLVSKDIVPSNPYSTIFFLAKRLVEDSKKNGYMVGFRGSIGASLVAYLVGITDINPLPAHYICPECHFTDFAPDEARMYPELSGYDLPDRNCPHCGHTLIKDGHNIPYESLLGLDGEKEPDIDLNVSDEYQPMAFAYLKKLLGADHVIHSGTITTYGERTLHGFVDGFCTRRDISMSPKEKDQIVQNCLGVKRSTGVHPGAVFIVPYVDHIYRYTPIQKPANDMTVDYVTTHFDGHVVGKSLLRYDILTHDDLTMLHYLEELTGVDPYSIPFDDKRVMALFRENEAGVGLSGFDNDLARCILHDVCPETFSDLVRIWAMSHGTGTWFGNAQKMIADGTRALSSCIGYRDEIMNYLVSEGVSETDAYEIMDDVRMGRVARGKSEKWAGWKKMMEEHGIPEWYIRNCETIQYLFPKAHAIGYVMMMWRIAYFKVYHPLEFYAAYFSIHASSVFSYEKMCQGRDHMNEFMEKLLNNNAPEWFVCKNSLIKDMQAVREVYDRGFEFAPIDIYQADDRFFKIVDGKLMPNLTAIDGMDEKAAARLRKAAREGAFKYKTELRVRAGLTESIVEEMDRLGMLGDMPEAKGIIKFKWRKEKSAPWKGNESQRDCSKMNNDPSTENVKYVRHVDKGDCREYFFKIPDHVADLLRKYTSKPKRYLRHILSEDNIVNYRIKRPENMDEIHQIFVETIERISNEGDEEYFYNHLISDNGCDKPPAEIHDQMRTEYGLDGSEIEWWVAHFFIRLTCILFYPDD